MALSEVQYYEERIEEMYSAPKSGIVCIWIKLF